MPLTEDLKSYKVPVVKEGSKHFFATNGASEWRTHDNINKSKCIAKIKDDYHLDLSWIIQLSEVPEKIKEHVRALLKKRLPEKAKLKRDLAKRAFKKRRTSSHSIVINGSADGSIICSAKKSSTTAEKAQREQEEKDERNIEEEADPSVWVDWLKFLKNHENAFHPYSPEANNIIRSGIGISPKPYLDRDIYRRHMQRRAEMPDSIPQAFHQYIDKYIESNDIMQAKKQIEALTLYLLTNEDNRHITANLKLLEQLLQQVQKSYESYIDYNSSEDAFNQLFIWPYLDVISKSIFIHNCKADFAQGQPILKTMSRQLKKSNLYVDDKCQYKSDGLVKLFGFKELEVLVLETSGNFINKDKSKINFDHHKAVFGNLSMLKNIADDYAFASIEQFLKVKVFFIQAADTELHLWSVCYKKEGIFDLWRECYLQIMPDFQDKQDFVPSLIQFFWQLKHTVEESVSSIASLIEEHSTTKAKYRYSNERPVLLNEVISPIILKLTKEDDVHGMLNLGPVYSPPHP
ncbi:uncharacterized protein B0P05DRAFT_601512 [Gilbertella persicaria]|uniref:uncharacterized protein n=1 Tax=Gilbertella persicaria TaxID=101096 RepID=UPI00221EFE97|nr:uncharacterized protein B0P05DRAFT_601512 [Gilbertella persicaria]KAI8097849.1 hypothetical protein B0P05DRAFT_601512 [Gilbertella persicaria]